MNPISLSSRFHAAWMLAKREWTRFFRQRNRVTAAVLQPLLFWLLFGTGLNGSFESAGGENFSQFFLPGTIALIVLFTAIFATISVIEDRREGFMQSVLVSPVGRFPVLLGKVLGGAAIAWVQALFFLLLVYLVGASSISSSFPMLLLMLAIIAIAMCGLGMIVAWPMESTQGFHAIMMLGLMPMWLLAGTFFPIPAWDISGPVGEAGWGGWVLAGVMRANPLSYSMVEMRRLMNPSLDLSSAGFAPASTTCWTVTIVATLVTLVIAWILMRGSRQVDTIV
ncbi:ABC-2 type transport system permease protein [Neorhodopirellula lusitana]|uniref:Transport permease protein n=1 Tax=Neorhodopirellula lusitana TaxID=445327 RepID=A0ABY1Q1G8_9BACT|nr:ABC transporter permease [Neorhodopirellula lusitana]SMP56408.1 ABC-2 type transport system permease protein [Neorhodopirellula lusitana]